MRGACTLVVKDEKILMVKEFKGWNLITETANDINGETLQGTAVRGVLEESGYAVELIGYLGDVDTVYKGEGLTIAIFLARLKSGEERKIREVGVERAEFMTAAEIWAIPQDELRFPELVPLVLERWQTKKSLPLDWIIEIPRIGKY